MFKIKCLKLKKKLISFHYINQQGCPFDFCHTHNVKIFGSKNIKEAKDDSQNISDGGET